MSSTEAFSIEQKLDEASANRDAGRLDEAVQLYRSILQENPQNAEAQKALHGLQKLMKKTPAKGNRRQNSKARTRKKVRLVKAGSASRQGSAQAREGLQPHSYDVQRLFTLYNSGKLMEAEAGARQHIQEFPHAVDVVNLLGTILGKLGKNEDAIVYYVQAITLKPDFAEAHNNLGIILRKLGLREQAEESYRLALAADPEFVQAYNNLGVVLRELDKTEEAVVSYQQALQLKPDDAGIHSNLGNSLQDIGRHKDAVASYRRALELKPESAAIYCNLGIALYALGKFKGSVACYMEALKFEPDYDASLVNFSDAVRAMSAIGVTPDVTPQFRSLLIRCLQDPNVDSANVSAAGMDLLMLDLQNQLDAGRDDLNDLTALGTSVDGLLYAYLKSALVNNPDIERALTNVRYALLKRNADAALGDVDQSVETELLEAFAYQGFLNEYLWNVTEDEEQSVNRLEDKVVAIIEGGSEPCASDLCLLAAYRSLCAVSVIRQWACDNFNKVDAGLKPVLRQLIINPAREIEIRDNLEQLTAIEGGVSMAVRSQYEENPYPRWDSLVVSTARPYIGRILKSIAPYRPVLKPTSLKPDVLIAGCGTGKHPIESAFDYQHSNVLAVDLSRASLAYAKRKAEELKVPNISFAQADILNLGELDKKFDIIECGGVLHHMADPEAGLKVLIGLLKPGGYLKLGLYSELARQHIVKLREFVSKEKFKSSLQGMRDFRAWLRASDLPESGLIQQSSDFYSASTLRDLLFHVQEHRFTVPQISRLLDKYDFDFLGFYLSNSLLKQMYAKQFPDDPDCVVLGNWHQFEQENPRMFGGMYQFWCQKRV